MDVSLLVIALQVKYSRGGAAPVFIFYPESITILPAAAVGYVSRPVRLLILGVHPMYAPRTAQKHLRSLLSCCVATVLVLPARGQQGSSTPPEIPSVSVDADQIIQDIARLAEQIEDPSERLRAISAALYGLGRFPPPQRQPVIDVLEEAAKHADDRTRTSTREIVVRHSPDVAMRIARRINDQRWRELYLSELVSRFVKDQPDRARDLLDEIKQSEARYKALLAYATADSLDLAQTCSFLEEAAALDVAGSVHSVGRPYAFSNALVRFAKDHPDQVADFLRTHLKDADRVASSLDVAWKLSHQLGAPEAARRVVEKTISLIPQTDDPAKSAIEVIRSGYSELKPDEARRLFDEFVLPTIDRRDRDTAYRLSILGYVDVRLLASRAEAVAKGQNKPLVDVLPPALGRAAHENPNPVVEWLKRQPASPLRAAAVAQVASMLQFHVRDRDSSAEAERRWFEVLSELAAQIEDLATRFEAVHAVLDFAEAAHLPTDDLLKDWRDLWSRLPESRPEPFLNHWFNRLPLDAQNRRLALRFERGSEEYWKHEEHSPWLTLQVISHSSLSPGKKAQLYRNLAREADQPLAAAACARYLAPHDYRESLRLLWQSLPEQRNPAMPAGDTSPPSERPLNAWAAMIWLRAGRDAYLRRMEAEALVEILWSHAHSIPSADRSPVLEELARVLLAVGEHEKALGVSRQMDNLPRRIRLMSEILDSAA